jgi:signal transduction histidine kinase
LKALEIDREMGLRKSMADVYLSIGVLFEEQGNLQEAVRYETMALTVAKELGALDYMKKAYEKLSLAHAKMNDYKGAYSYNVLHEAASDSLFNAEKNKTLVKLQLQYDYDKKQLSDSLRFAQEKELTEVRLQRQRAYTYGSVAGIGLIALLLFVVYRNYIRQREVNRKLKETQQQLIKSEKMAAYGVMASRVAHEIQNPLNFVNNFSELSQEQVKEIISQTGELQCQDTAKALLESLQKINHHGKRAGNIVRQLQELSRTGKAQTFFEEGLKNSDK